MIVHNVLHVIFKFFMRVLAHFCAKMLCCV